MQHDRIELTRGRVTTIRTIAEELANETGLEVANLGGLRIV